MPFNPTSSSPDDYRNADGTPAISRRGAGYDPTLGFDPTKDLGRDNALPGQNYYDPRIKEITDAQGGRDANFFQEKLNYGTDKGQIGNPYGESSDPMVKALQSRYQNYQSEDAAARKTQSKFAGESEAAKSDQNLARELSADYQNQVQNFNAQYEYQIRRYNMYQEYETQKAKAESSLWGSIFGGIGKLVGTVLGSSGEGDE